VIRHAPFRCFSSSCGLALLLASCAPPAVARAPSVTLRATDGPTERLDAALREHAVTAVLFFSAHCHCQRMHDPRVRELIAQDEPRGVGFLIVDSEESATPAGDAEEGKLRGYRIWLDDGGKLARALGAEYATFSVVFDHDGNVLYKGGFDSDHMHLRDDRTPYLSDAIDDALDHRPVRRPETKTLGCTLELR